MEINIKIIPSNKKDRIINILLIIFEEEIFISLFISFDLPTIIQDLIARIRVNVIKIINEGIKQHKKSSWLSDILYSWFVLLQISTNLRNY